MHLQTYPLGQLQTNCYLLEQNGECIIIDPADDAGFLLEELSRRNLKLMALLATHGHFDHIMAVGEIQLSFDVPFYISDKDLFLVKRVKETARHFLGYEPFVVPPKQINSLPPKRLTIGEFAFEIIPTPGHTPGSVSYHISSEQSVFTGDTLFRQAVGRTDLSYSSKPDLENSLLRLFDLPEETEVYPGHGEETTILAEKQEITSG